MLTHRVGTVAIRQIPRCLMSCAEFSLGLQFSLHHFDHSTRVLTHNWKSSPHVTNSSTLLLVANQDVPSVQFMVWNYYRRLTMSSTAPATLQRTNDLQLLVRCFGCGSS